jgi:two-component system sensor histidine kinase BaeS
MTPYVYSLLVAALVGGVLAAAAAFLLARRVARPVRRVAEASRELARGQHPEPVPVEGGTELETLANAFNDLAVQLAKAREAERSFLLSVSHELKTPLTAIRGYAEAVEDGAIDAREAAATVAVEAARLERLVRDLLDLARMNRSEFSVRSEAVDLAEVAREVARRHEPTARELGVDLRAVAGEAWVLGDADRILQIASNLVENALRETPGGGAVTVEAAGSRLVVSDTGPGIPAADLPHAFERFYLYDKFGRDRLIGSGLGLAIVRQLATAMGGTVDVESSDAGTTFTVTLRPQAGGVDDFEVGPVESTERV